MRNRKRVCAVRRAPDGSAFQRCDECGASVPVALLDIHECQVMKKEVKKFKGQLEQPVVIKHDISMEPRSPFNFFYECFVKIYHDGGDMIQINRKAFERWKAMSSKERSPYIDEAEKVDKAYIKGLLHEASQMSQQEDDEADSAMVGKFVQDLDDDSECSGSSYNCWSEECGQC